MTGKVFNGRTGQITTKVDTAEEIAQREADYAEDVAAMEYLRSLRSERQDIDAISSREELLEDMADAVVHIANKLGYLQDPELGTAMGKLQAIKSRKARGKAERGES